MTPDHPAAEVTPEVRAEAEVGYCALCGQLMIRTADDCWHPWDVATPCPPEPGRMTESRENYEAWQRFHAAGLHPGRPGREHFRAALGDADGGGE